MIVFCCPASFYNCGVWTVLCINGKKERAFIHYVCEMLKK